MAKRPPDGSHEESHAHLFQLCIPLCKSLLPGLQLHGCGKVLIDHLAIGLPADHAWGKTGRVAQDCKKLHSLAVVGLDADTVHAPCLLAMHGGRLWAMESRPKLIPEQAHGCVELRFQVLPLRALLLQLCLQLHEVAMNGMLPGLAWLRASAVIPRLPLPLLVAPLYLLSSIPPRVAHLAAAVAQKLGRVLKDHCVLSRSV